MERIFEVADWFLSKEPMTHKKLQKLCYYYKAWGLALYNRDLLPDAVFQAWVHGPVCPTLYQKYKGYGWNKLPGRPEAKPDIFDEEETEILESVWFTYGGLSANALEAQTHSEDPWKLARAGLDDFQNCENVISNESMKTYYMRLYFDNQGD